MTEMITNSTTVEELVKVIGKNASVLGIDIPKINRRNIACEIKCLKFLELIGGIDLDTGSSERVRPFTDVIKFVDESKVWYEFLNSLYEKFSDYEIQKDRQRYNVADLDDWGKSDKPQGIAITSSTYNEFLNKICAYNIKGYDEVKDMTVTELQLEELNHILYLTLKHKMNVQCSGKQAFVKGDFLSLREVITQISSDKDNCRDFLARLKSGKLEFVNIFALNTLFLDHDVLLQGLGVQIIAIAPRWKIIGKRKIDLSGFPGVPHSNPKAKEGFHGEPGKAGGPGGIFLGIGEIYVNGANLTVTANGGSGGPGQDGGNGQKGRDGRSVELPLDVSSRDRLECCKDGKTSNGFRCEKTVLNSNLPRFGKLDWGDSVRYYNFQHEDYKLYGLPGKRGGDGGNGGRSGKGGHPGSVTIVELDKSSEISKFTNTGEDGKEGRGGSGGRGGRDGGDANARCLIRRPNWCLLCVRDKENIQWVLDVSLSNSRRNASGKDGISGANSVNMEYLKSKRDIHDPASVINQYKMFLRENMVDRFKKYTLKRFHDLLNNKNSVRGVYDTLGLVEEMRGLENQYPKLNTKIDFLSFFHSLLERVEEYALHPKSGENSKEYKKVLSYLYAAALSRIRNQSGSSESDLIIDISKYLETIAEGIESLKDLQNANNKADAIRRINEEYKTRTSTKLQEAIDFVQRIITPEISRINNQIDEKIDALIEETVSLQRKTKDEKKDLIAKREELQNRLMLKALFDNFKIVGRVASFLGPFGAVTGSAIEATTSVVKSVVLDHEQQTQDISDIVSNINSLGDGIKMIRSEKIVHLNKLFEELSQIMTEHPEELGDLSSQVEDMKSRLSKINQNKYDFKEVKTLESELRKTLERKEIDLKREDNSDKKKSINALAIVGKIKQLAQFGSLFVDIYNRNRENEEKIDVLTEAIGKKENELEILREYEDKIYDTIMPMLQTMEIEIQEVTKKLEGKSHVSLDVTKWQVQNVLKDIKIQMLRLTGRFEVKDELARCIEKLEEAMTTLINVYDRIERHKDEDSLVDYIMNISSVSASSIPVRNSTLASAINHLDWSIRSNLVLKQYKTAVHAFKQ
ncbi:hypothetical protein AVEN_198812-1 [Araneus ventricosus]|uniref:Uncharacterized protein n=1 Tax=Araneus ventricosus TaxID=182803 RepID=A0A4Y2KF67_ARAVE|nr:hypothetical protein AVEN_198812-1 [Araneus ventricosus]